MHACTAVHACTCMDMYTKTMLMHAYVHTHTCMHHTHIYTAQILVHSYMYTYTYASTYSLHAHTCIPARWSAYVRNFTYKLMHFSSKYEQMNYFL